MKVFLSLLAAIMLACPQGSSNNLVDPNPSIYLVANPQGTGFGTGFQLQTKKGPVIITNRHVCGKNSIMFALKNLSDDTAKLLVVKIVSTKYDLCMLSGLPNVAPLTLAYDYAPGDTATVEGYPLGVRKIVHGVLGMYAGVAARGGLPETTDMEFSGLVNNGNSGSPVTNLSGQVIGVLNIKRADKKDVPGKGLFIPLEFLKDFLETNHY